MSILVSLLNRGGEIWAAWLVPATLQAALVGLVILVLIAVGRRWPAPLRYGLLLLALLKFAVPPSLGCPWGIFSQWPREASVTPTESRIDAVPQATPPSLPNASRPLETPEPLEVEAEKATSSSSPLVASPRVPPRSTTVAEREPLHLPAWLFLGHLLGSGVMAVWIVRQCVLVRRHTRAAAQVSDGPFHARYVGLCQRMRLRRVPRLLLIDDGYPFSFGLLRPAVVLPRALVNHMPAEELKTVLGHELAHHRRGDLWANWFELLLCAVWWFHPVAWLLSRASRRAREECCDDFLLAHGWTSGVAYCQTLLRVARQARGPLPWQATLGMAERWQPLEERFRRVLDTAIPRRARLSWPTRAAMLALALLILPGLRAAEPTTSSTHESNLSSEDGPAQPRDPDKQVSPTDHPKKLLSGRIVDEHGQPIAGARLVVAETIHRQIDFTMQEITSLLNGQWQSDASGRFSVECLDLWSQSDYRTLLRGITVFAHAPGREVAVSGNLAASVVSHVDLANLTFTLEPATDTTLTILDADGKPVSDAQVRLLGHHRSESGILAANTLPWPFPFCGGRTDRDGHVQLPVPSRERHSIVEVLSPSQGIQNMMHDLRESTIRLARTGRIEGRVITDQPELLRHLRLAFQTRPQTPSGPSVIRGSAAVENGRFTVPTIAAGMLEVSLDRAMEPTPPAEVLPRIPPRLMVEPGVTTHVDVTLVPAVRVSGVVLYRNEPLADTGVTISSEAHSIQAMTDAQGTYRALVLPGPITIRPEIPYALNAATATVPADAHVFTVPPLKAATKPGDNWPFAVPYEVEQGMQADRMQFELRLPRMPDPPKLLQPPLQFLPQDQPPIKIEDAQ